MREELSGYDQNYQYGSDPKIDQEIDELNRIVQSYGGGIRVLENQGAFLELSDKMPEDIVSEARQAASNVLVAMGVSPLNLKEDIQKNEEKKKISKIIQFAYHRDFESILNMIKESEDKNTLQFIFKAFSTPENGRFVSSYSMRLVDTALSNLNQFEQELKALILYFWERGTENPRFLSADGYHALFLDDDGEIVQFRKEPDYIEEELDIGTGPNILRKKVGETLKYTLLTGSNKGKEFQATHKDKLNYRPIKRFES